MRIILLIAVSGMSIQAQTHTTILRGTVIGQDGRAPSTPARIELACLEGRYYSTETGPDGRFQIWLDVSPATEVQPAASGFVPAAPGLPLPRPSMHLCTVEVTAPGFHVERIPIEAGMLEQAISLSPVVLRPVRSSGSMTISVDSLRVPRQARKQFERGVRKLRAGELAGAQQAFEDALRMYTRYADASLGLGHVHTKQRNFSGAEEAFQRALVIEPKLLSAQLGLIASSLEQRRWGEARDRADSLLAAGGDGIAEVRLMKAVASFHLRDWTEAEQSASEAQRLANERPSQAEHLLGLILAQQGRYAAAARHLRAFLRRATDPEQIALARKQLELVERFTQR